MTVTSWGFFFAWRQFASFWSDSLSCPGIAAGSMKLIFPL
jgi:hypothetical protein